jgi:NADH/F420H2 dehydrogenase subunit C
MTLPSHPLTQGPLVARLAPRWITRLGQAPEGWTLQVPSQHLLALCRLLRDHEGLRYAQLMDLTAVDRPHETPRFEVVYHFLSVEHQCRLRVKVPLAEGDPLPSVTALYPAAGWWERELWDMFGLFVTGHPDLRRLLTDYGFQGHPLRKDFPLSGFTEVRYDAGEQRVVTEPVSLAQEARVFDLGNPWTPLPEAPGLSE